MSAINHEFDLAGATMLPPLGATPDGGADTARAELLAARWEAVHAAADAVANGLVRGLGAPGGDIDAAQKLAEVYGFLGGRTTDFCSYPILLPDTPAPRDRCERWRWFVDLVEGAAAEAETLWQRVIDPAS